MQNKTVQFSPTNLDKLKGVRSIALEYKVIQHYEAHHISFKYV